MIIANSGGYFYERINMDFLPHMVSSDRNNVFINKAKKQAKRLYKLSQKNDNQLNIENLAQAQDILAQLNGYEDWHAMIQSIQTAQIKHNLTLPKPYQYLTIKNQDQFELMQETNENNILDFSTKYPYLVGTEYLYSFINIDIYKGHNEEVLKSYDFNESLIYLLGVLQYYGKDIKEDSSFQLIIEKKELETDLISWTQQVELAKKCGIDPDIAQSLFTVEYPTKTTTALHLCLVVKTPIHQKAKHYKNINRLLMDNYGYLQMSVKPTISTFIMDIIKNQSSKEYTEKTIPTKGFTGFFKADDINDHIELVSYLNYHCNDWAGVIELTKNSFTIYHKSYHRDNINNALHNFKKCDSNLLKIKLANPTNLKGIPFVKVPTQQTDCVDFKNRSYRGNNSIFMGNNDLKHVLSNYINYVKTLEHVEEYKYLPTSFYISSGTQEPLYNLLISTLELENNIQYIHLDEGKHFINILDTKLGLKDLNQEYFNSTLMKILYGSQYSKNIVDEKLHELFLNTKTLIEDLYAFNENNPKMYQYGINQTIDESLNQTKINSSWFALSAYYMNQSKPLLSQICHYNAMPTLKDLESFIVNNKEKYADIFNNIYHIENIIKNLQQFIINNPLLTEVTNIYIEDKHIYFFDLDGIDNCSMIIDLLTFHIFEQRKKIEDYYSPNNLEECFKDYYKNINLHNKYSISVSYDYFDNKNQHEAILLALRESRKFNIDMQLITYEAHEYLLDYSHLKFFTSTIHSPNVENEVIKNSQNLQHNEFLIYGYSNQVGNFKNHYKFVINDNLYKMLIPE